MLFDTHTGEEWGYAIGTLLVGLVAMIISAVGYEKGYKKSGSLWTLLGMAGAAFFLFWLGHIGLNGIFPH